MTPTAVIKEAWCIAISALASHSERCTSCVSAEARCPTGRALYDAEQACYTAYRHAREAEALVGGTV